jgi:tetratricopeptide (TPR) repeat protein
MTASSLGLKKMRPQLAAALVVLQALTLLAFSGPARADDPVKGEVKVFSDSGYARLMFRFDEAVPATVHFNFPVVVVTFKKPVAVAVERLNENAPGYISAARIDPDGTAIRIALTKKMKVHSIPAAERLYVDLLPEPWAGVMPGLPEEVVEELANRAREAERQLHRQRLAAKDRKPPTVRVRVASQPTFIRYVFELPDGINVVPDRHDDQLTLNFDQPIKWDLADVMATLPPTLKAVDVDVKDESVAVNFVLNGTPNVRTFHEDRSIAVDIGLDGAKPKQAAEAGAAKPAAAAEAPAIAPPETVPAKADAVPEQPADQAKSAAAAPLVDGAPPPEKAADKQPAAPAADKMPAAPPAKAKENPPAVPKAASDGAPAAAQPAPKTTAPPAPPAPKLAATAEPQSAAQPAPKDVAPKTVMPETAAPKAAAAKPSAAPKSAPADPARPAPDPTAPVAAELHSAGNGLRVEFPFAVPTPAAVFQRADMLWLVFDSAARIDLAALTREPDGGIRDARFERAKNGAAIVRLHLTRPRLVSVVTDGPAWIVTVGDSVTVPTQPLAIARSIVGKNRASIAIPFDNPRAIHHITDPAVGDRLMVVTALGPARGFLKPQEFVELRALPSAQGVVLQPLADDLTAALAVDKITVSRPSGLSLSPTAIGQQRLATSFRALTFDTQLWGFNRQAKYNARQSDLIFDAAMAPPPKRRKARLDLARFYLARGMSAEAVGVLEVALADKHGADDITGTVLKAVANVMLDRPTDALKDLSNPQVGNQLDAPVWRAIAFARQGKWMEAHERFKDVEAALGGLPIELQRMALREQLHAAIEVRDFNAADRVINELETLGVPPEMEASIAVLVGRLDQGLGRNEDALTNYRAAAASRDQRAVAQGRLREIMLRFAMGDMPRKDVTDQLETLTTIWRGDETESEGLKLLAHLYTEDSRYRDAFHVMRTAMLAHPNSDLTRQIQDEAAATFESLFLNGKGDALPPIEALALFYDYRELTPIGRSGDEMIRKLADRLISVDLLDQAAELLQHQVDHRLQGAARAQVATHLAVVYLMNRKPQRALAALRATRTEGLSNELRDQRLLLEARALSETGRHDLALEMIANIRGHQAIRLRADILWAAKRWRQAGEQIELLYGERWRDFAPLSVAERVDILRAAIGYALGDEPIGLARFRDKYAAKMADTPDRHAFEVVTAPVGASGTEFKNVARTVAGADTLDEFLSDMRKRYPDSAPVSPDGAAAEDKAAAAAPQEKPQAEPQAAKAPTGTAKQAAPEEAAAKAKPDPAAASPLPPKAPAGVPLKPEPATTGSIPRLPRARATSR